jgi:hypothetical protein
VFIETLVRYLIGDRQAILALAADRRAVWVGLLFVLSAGFAREYDGQDLLRDPWHLFVPLIASLAASFLLFLVTCSRLFPQREDRPPFLSAYRSFLILFWMTAPLAWLYAVPYERFLSAGDATRANLWTLAIVAAWRVLLMTRVVSVVTARGPWPSFFLVMAFADAVALAAVAVMPKPIIPIMGGVRYTESEQAVLSATVTVFVGGMFSAPIWLIGAIAAFSTGKPVWQVPAIPPSPSPIGRGAWIVSVASLLVWLPILPFTQNEQQLRTRVEEAMKNGRIADGLELMSAHAKSDFLPGWDPPPRVGYGERSPTLHDVLVQLAEQDRSTWVRDSYIDKLMHTIDDWYRITPEREAELFALVRILRRMPEGPAVAARFVKELGRSVYKSEDSACFVALKELANLD